MQRGTNLSSFPLRHLFATSSSPAGLTLHPTPHNSREDVPRFNPEGVMAVLTVRDEFGPTPSPPNIAMILGIIVGVIAVLSITITIVKAARARRPPPTFGYVPDNRRPVRSSDFRLAAILCGIRAYMYIMDRRTTQRRLITGRGRWTIHSPQP